MTILLSKLNLSFKLRPGKYNVIKKGWHQKNASPFFKLKILQAKPISNPCANQSIVSIITGQAFVTDSKIPALVGIANARGI